MKWKCAGRDGVFICGGEAAEMWKQWCETKIMAGEAGFDTKAIRTPLEACWRVTIHCRSIR